MRTHLSMTSVCLAWGLAGGLAGGAFAGYGLANSLWPGADEGKPQPIRSLVSDVIANRKGDVLTIIISETTQAGNQASASTNHSVDGSVSAGQGLLSFIPFLSMGQKDKSGFKGDQTWKGSFVSSMTAVVTEVTPEGLLQIEGSRTVDLNGEKQVLTLTGKVRPYDVSRKNTINSQQIADAEIHYKGRGPMGQGAKPGIITRLFEFLF